MLGFGGHFLAEGRRYSITSHTLRVARITYQRAETSGPSYQPVDRQPDLAEYLGHSDPAFTLRVYALMLPTSDDRAASSSTTTSPRS